MKATYAVTWQNGDGRTVTGRLDLGPESLLLEGGSNGDLVHEEVAYRELRSVTVGRRGGERLDGRQALVVERSGREVLRIAGISEPGIVSELAARLADLAV